MFRNISALGLGVVAVTAGCVAPQMPEPDFTTPGSITIASGDDQVAPAGQPFPQPLLVEVWTPDDTKCNGCRVVWDLNPGGFSQGPVQGMTSVIGSAGLQVSGLSPAGDYTVSATIDNGQTVDFHLGAR